MVQMAFSEISRLDGAKGFFRGAGALMFREVPFYVAGMVRARRLESILVYQDNLSFIYLLNA
jgi:hypothetical protein